MTTTNNPFPRVPWELDKRRKLKQEDVELMRELHRDGWSIYKIADKFDVHWLTAKKKVDLEYAKNLNKRISACIVARYHRDIEFRERVKFTSGRSVRRTRKLNPKPYKDWQKVYWRGKVDKLKGKESI